jgi:AI-2 transport protein TqsA
MAKPIITLNGLKIVIMLGMLVIILTGVRFAADIIVPFILALFIAVILNPLVQRMVRLRVPRVLAITLLIGIIIVAMVLLVAYLGTSLNELARTLPKYRSSLVTPLLQIEPWLQRAGIEVSVEELLKYIDPNAAMTLVTSLLAQLSNAMTSIFLLFLTVVFMLLEVPQLPAKLQQIMIRPVEGMGAIQRALDSVSRYLVLKTAISLVTGLVVWGCSSRWMCVLRSYGGCWPLRLTIFPISARCWRLFRPSFRCWSSAGFMMHSFYWRPTC